MKVDEKDLPDEKTKFQINSTYQGFADRQKNVFDQLNVMELTTRNTLANNEALMDTDETTDNVVEVKDVNRMGYSRKDSRIKHLRGKESIFKRPQSRAPRSITNRKIPDYQINPHKWTRYSLDVPNEDMSDRANTSTALSFLKELKSRKQQNTDLEVEGEVPKKIVFKKGPSKNREHAETTSFQAIFRNSKLVMPEYVVGEKVKKVEKPKKTSCTAGSTKEIKLDHLLESDED